MSSTEVTLTNLGTNEKRKESTNADGLYQFVNVVPGQYSIEIQKTGFKRIRRSPVTVETQSTSKIDVALEVGELDSDGRGHGADAAIATGEFFSRPSG